MRSSKRIRVSWSCTQTNRTGRVWCGAGAVSASAIGAASALRRSSTAAVGGASNSQHMYGIAADIVISGKSVSQAISYAQSSGFSGIIRYSTFTHVDSRVEYPQYGAASWYWSV